MALAHIEGTVCSDQSCNEARGMRGFHRVHRPRCQAVRLIMSKLAKIVSEKILNVFVKNKQEQLGRS
eukprot:15008-Amphidinium_carterae.1